jgi:hypothetical protein
MRDVRSPTLRKRLSALWMNFALTHFVLPLATELTNDSRSLPAIDQTIDIDHPLGAFLDGHMTNL